MIDKIMNLFMLALGVFILNFTHLVSAIGGLRDALIAKYSRSGFFGVYGTASTLALVLIVFGFYQRDFMPVYEPPLWGAEFNKGAMFLAFWLVVGQLFNGWFKQLFKAPLIVGIGVWAFGHLCANGDLHSIILFGGFLIYALVGIYFKLQKKYPAKTYHYRQDVKAFFIAFVVYACIGMLHPFFTGIRVF